MSFVRIRNFQTESFRLAALYAGLFVGSMLVLIALIYIIVTHSFEADLLRNSDDDLLASYLTAARIMAEGYLSRALITQTLLWTVRPSSMLRPAWESPTRWTLG